MFDAEMLRDAYAALEERVAAFRARAGRPLMLTEKVLGAHLAADDGAPPVRGESYVALRPDRVAMQDATAQMALLQFALTGRDRVAVPTTVHCDHLVRARDGATDDLVRARETNGEVYAFLRSASAKYGAGFWEPGAGIIHQTVLEHYAFPGGMMIGTDSHTPNAGGLGMVAVGVGGADAMEVMAGLPLSLRWPRVIGVRLTGALHGWASPKDVILKLLELLSVKGGTGAVVEYFGPGAATLSATGKATICNMGAELGATCSLFPFDDRMAAYLSATGRGEVTELAQARAAALRADPDVAEAPDDHYDRVIEIDLAALEPLITGPHTPDRVRPLTALGAEAHAEGWPREIGAALIGSCTNSSYQDMDRAAALARQAAAVGLRARTPLLVSPGSQGVAATLRRDGQLAALEAIGATVLANACGPCIGQWDRPGVVKGKPSSIVTSYNRNFSARNDGNPATNAFIAGPEIVVALALAGRLDFDPARDTLAADDGRAVRLDPPQGDELPAAGFAPGAGGYTAPPADGREVALEINPASERLALLEPFAPITADDLRDLPVLAKVAGKCTTDHVSPAGPWLRYRGHLANISGNSFSGAHNAFTDETGTGINQLTGAHGSLPDIARAYRDAGIGWVVVADANYGEGSSREHAAMSPRWLGCRAIIARSFARIAETNLKKQGILPLAFADPAAWEVVRANDRLTIGGLAELGPSSELVVTVRHADGGRERFACDHSLDVQQVAWFRAGSALNHLRAQAA